MFGMRGGPGATGTEHQPPLLIWGLHRSPGAAPQPPPLTGPCARSSTRVEMGRPGEIRIAAEVGEATGGGHGLRKVSPIRVPASAVPVMRGTIRV